MKAQIVAIVLVLTSVPVAAQSRRGDGAAPRATTTVRAGGASVPRAVPRVGAPVRGAYPGGRYYGYPYGAYYGPYAPYYGLPFGYPGFAFAVGLGPVAVAGGYRGGGGGYGYPAPISVGVAIPSPGSGESGIRVVLEQRDAEVFIDGLYVGVVADLDGTWQKAPLDPGPHRLEIRRDGFEPVAVDVYVHPGRTVIYRTPLKRR